jgi:hypothetical protein
MAKRRTSQAGRSATSTRQFEQELRREVKALKPQPLPEPDGRGRLDDELRAVARSSASQLEPLVFASPSDLKRAKSIVTDANKQRARLVKAFLSAPKEPSTPADDPYAAITTRRREVLELMAQSGAFFDPTLIALKPFLIWMRAPHSSMLRDSKIAPVGYSWAKVKGYFSGGNGEAQLSFYYYWVNQSAYPAGINVETNSVFNGYVEVDAYPGLFGGGHAKATIAMSLIPHKEWDLGAALPPQGVAYPVSLSVDTGSFLTSDFAYDRKNLWQLEQSLRYDAFVIPPGATGMFELRVIFRSETDEGMVSFDFSTIPAYYHVATRCQLELLTGPPVAHP